MDNARTNTPAGKRRPNFLLFITDQQRADHLGCYGNAKARTPHIDALAGQGCVFNDFHVATPLCQPNRSSLMTSRMPSLHGVQMNGRELSQAQTTFVELLRAAGYRTGLVGKAHLQNITELPAAWPAPGEARAALEAVRRHPGVYGQEQWRRWEEDPQHDLVLPYYGFDAVRLTVGHADEQHGHWRRWLRAQTPDADRLIGAANALPTPDYQLSACGQAWRTRVPEELYPTRYIADRCCDLLDGYADAGAPFFLQCSFPDPHHPYTPPGRYWDLFHPDDIAVPGSFGTPAHALTHPLAQLYEAARQGRSRKGGHGVFACTDREAREAIALNYGSLACIDDAVGRVLSRLRALGLDDDTVVMFTSDHGDMLGDQRLLLKGGLHYRALTRVPFVWRDTLAQRAPRRTGALAQTIDIATTVLDRAGIQAANGMQGVTLLDVALGRTDTARSHALIEEEGQRRDFGLPHRLRLRSLVTASHRITLYAGQPWGELYDLRADPQERCNLWRVPGAAALRAERMEALARAMVEAADCSPYPAFAA